MSSLGLQEVFQRAYGDPEAARRYHEECDFDPKAEVGPWSDGRREVVFRTKVNAPAVVTRALGG